MRISRIKLAGFKSFVDPTILELPDNLTGVVGPNGCGKSNIIDAMLWVLGESSAKHLRGDSMADVIFNGSNTRQPVGQASVDIVFDNSKGTLAGQYAAYNEISVKRQLGRDGISAYFLNGTRCRRKDVIDVFLGTGVGKGGYSVIEQGMISRVIEARPEELRGFLEEAAGISRYKERRRETQNRIQHTHDNLDRVNDIRTELETQLNHLERQVRAAERYQHLQAEARKLRARLLAVRLRNVNTGLEAGRRLAQEGETALEQALVAVRRCEDEINAKRARSHALSDAFNRAQSRFYTAAADISRLEQALSHSEQRREELDKALLEARSRVAETNEQLSRERALRDRLSGETAELTPALDAARAAEVKADDLYRRVHEEHRAWQESWDEFNAEAAELSRVERVEQLRLEHLEEDIRETDHRLQGLRAEQERLDPRALEAAADTARASCAALESQLDGLNTERERQQHELQRARAELKKSINRLAERRLEFEAVSGRIASLKQLQDAAFGRDNATLLAWLSARGADTAPRLADEIEIEAGWERALETVLKIPLDTFCSDELARVLASADRRGHLPARVTALGTEITAPQSGAQDDSRLPGAQSLASKIRCRWPLATVLAGVYAVDGLDRALPLRARLAAHESLVTPEGAWIGPNWLQLPAADAQDAGILERARLLATLSVRAEWLATQVRELAAEEREREAAGRVLEQAGEQVAQRLQELQERSAAARAELARHETQLEQARSRVARIDAEVGDLAEASGEDTRQLARVRKQLGEVRDRLAGLAHTRRELTLKRDEIRARVESMREALANTRARTHELALRLESLRVQHAATTGSLQRHGELLERLQRQCLELQDALQASQEPEQEIGRQLAAAREARAAVETELATARRDLDANEGALRDAEQRQIAAAEIVDQRRQALEQARLSIREAEVRGQDLLERIDGTGFSPAELDGENPADVTEEQIAGQLADVEARIARLGAINLAAVDEHAQAAERKQFLDAQCADLTAALENLREAMRKIDRETRTRFQETFDNTNRGLQKLFPRLFGGGHAYLELTGEDLLEAGVTVMARPPGKKNSTIHLLSGGEKALTALAFVFSLFQLNPAPFCLLDEVDAPLDDANVVRFCELVRGMASEIQFLFVTHNKITMELASHLVGVTMHEPGVSRLVAVDMEQAVQMAASA
jgi:chromosome segregation protein